jgi:hypothetical protein
VSSTYGVDRTAHPSFAGDWPLLADTPTLVIEEVAASRPSSEEDDAFQWFVSLFVAEYASEQ